jgi:RNA polymerase sigma factor (sigma-70 family)
MPGSSSSENPAEVLFLHELSTIERVLRFVTTRHRLPASEAEDFASHVKTRMVENGYAILKQFQGRSSLRTYLTVVIQRMYLDYRASGWGKWRPSAEAVREGPLAVLLEQLLWRDGYSFDQACQMIRTGHSDPATPEELERIAGALPARPRRRFESEMVLAERATTELSPFEAALAEERRRLANRVSTALKRLTSDADHQDRLILALRFEDGRTVADIAALLGLEPKPLYRRFERLLGRLRDGLQQEGISPADILRLFDDPAVSIDWLGPERKSASSGPSLTKGART